MAEIGKKSSKLRDPAHKQDLSARREEDQYLRSQETTAKASRTNARLRRPGKQKRYDQDIDILDKVGPQFRGSVGYKIVGNKKLRIEKDGELTLERGIFRKTRKVLKEDPDSKQAYVARFERESADEIERYEFGAKGELLAVSRDRHDGSFHEKWEPDENGELIRTSFFTNRLRDGRLFRAVSEEMSAPYERGPDNKKYRTLTRTKGSKVEVYERDSDGHLELIAREKRGLSMTKSRDGKTADTKITRFGSAFSKSYRSLLDEGGKELSRISTSNRRLLNKRSYQFDKTKNNITGSKHTFGKLYKRTDNYAGESSKVVSKKILGIKISSKIKGLTQKEIESLEAWKSLPPFHKPPLPGRTKQLASTVKTRIGSVDLNAPQPPGQKNAFGTVGAKLAGAQSAGTSAKPGVEPTSNIAKTFEAIGKAEAPASTPAAGAPSRRLAMIARAVQQRDQAGSPANSLAMPQPTDRQASPGASDGQVDISKSQPPGRQNTFGSTTTLVDQASGKGQVDLAKSQPPGRQNTFGSATTLTDSDEQGRAAAGAAPGDDSSNNIDKLKLALAGAQTSLSVNAKPQSTDSAGSRRDALEKAAELRDAAAQRAGLDKRAVAGATRS